MKNLAVLVFAVFLGMFRLSSQSCLPYGITFDTQSAIDNFHNNYPNCTEIGGDVLIAGYEVHNLNGLSGLTSIGGNLTMMACGALSSISGLSSLTSVGGSLNIDGTVQLTSLNGLNTLESIGGDLIIGDYNGNNNLTNLNGLSSLESVGGGLQVWFNLKLTSLAGLNNLSSIGGNVDIYRNSMLLDLSGLENLISVGGYFTIYWNSSLSGLSGLTSLASVGGKLQIAMCDGLVNLSGLDDLSSIGGYLEISYNDGLTSLSGLNNLINIGGDLVIDNNDGLTSLSGLEGLSTLAGNIDINDNDLLIDLSGLDNLSILGGNMVVKNNDLLNSLAGLENIATVGGDLIIHENIALTVLTGLNGLASVARDVLIYDNPALRSLTGLESISTIGRDIYIHGNAALASLSGLGGIQSIGRNFEISDNDLLASLAGLESIDPESITNLNIWDNASLAACDAESICAYLASPNGTVNIHTNAAGCNYPHEIADACGMTMPCLPYGNYFFYTQEDVDSFPANYPGCTELGGSVMIYGSEIGSLEGLGMVTSIGENFIIEANDSLADLNPLINLATIGGDLRIMNSHGLTTLSGLDNIDPVSLNSLLLMNNNALSECDVESICYFINNFSPKTYITNNAAGCSSIQQVAEACGVLSVEEAEMIIHCTAFPNPGKGSFRFVLRSSQFPVTGSHGQKVRLSIYDTAGTELARLIDTHLPSGEHFFTWDAHEFPSGVYFYRLYSDRQMSTGKLILVK